MHLLATKRQPLIFEKYEHGNRAETQHSSSMCILIEVCFQAELKVEIISRKTVTCNSPHILIHRTSSTLSCCLITPTCGKHCINSSPLVSMQITDDHKFTFTAHKYNTDRGLAL